MTFILKNLTDILFYLSFAFFIVTLANLPAFVLWTPPAAYVVWNLINLRRFTGIFKYDGIFRLFLKAYTPFALICLVFARQSFEANSMPFAIAFLVCAVVLMRIVRQPPDIQRDIRFKAMSLIPVLLAVMAGLIIASSQVLGIFRWILYTIYFGIIAPVLMLAINLLVLFISFLDSLVDFSLSDWIAQRAGEPNIMEQGIPPQEEFYPIYRTSDPSPYINAVLAILAIALAVFLLIKLFKKFNVKQLAPRGVIPQYSFTIPTIKTKKRAHIGPLRKQYRKFLQLCWRHGVAKQVNLTSADYARLSEMGADAEQLRDIYIQVRYDEKTATKSDINFAKELYRRMRAMK